MLIYCNRRPGFISEFILPSLMAAYPDMIGLDPRGVLPLGVNARAYTNVAGVVQVTSAMGMAFSRDAESASCFSREAATTIRWVMLPQTVRHDESVWRRILYKR